MFIRFCLFWRASRCLATRVWARGIRTEYRYHPTGELAEVDYSDQTPDISFTYDRLGRKKGVVDALGTRRFSYNKTMQPAVETIPGITISRRYDSRGRIKGFDLGDYHVSYRYDPEGRFSSVAWKIEAKSGSVVYRYLADSDLVSGYTSGDISVAYIYDRSRNLKTAVTSKNNNAIISRYEYQYDRLGRRLHVRTSGRAFSEGAFCLYSYTGRNEVESSFGFNGTSLTDQTRPLAAEGRYYQYDPIGNRTTALEGNQQSVYETNELNQYEKIINRSEQSLSYDPDGNLTGLTGGGEELSGSRYFYNGENRLVSIIPFQPQSGDLKTENVYDYMGRRVQKTTSAYRAGTWVKQSTKKFVYDDWNLIAELDEAGEVTRYFVWGLDLSQTLQGAGGIGGLICAVDSSSGSSQTYQYFYDGNGNVGQVVNSADGTIVASYTYDPFGKTIKSDGVYAAENRFKFSTRYTDIQTAFNYFGKRYYNSNLGRWITRDPIEEEGGLNLYGFVQNDPVNWIDAFGTYTIDDAVKSLQKKGVLPPIASPGMSNTRLPIYTDSQKFNEWLLLEEKLGSWWTALPKCPEKICLKSKEKAENPDKNIWSDPNTDFTGGVILSSFHPGAKFELRTIRGVTGAPHGNQCTYDCDGNLIRSIPAAGSVDLYGPNNDFGSHQDHDVATYKLAEKLGRVSDYYSRRPTW